MVSCLHQSTASITCAITYDVMFSLDLHPGLLGITHRRTAYNHPEGNGLIERFHCSLKEEEIWLNESRSLAETSPT